MRQYTVLIRHAPIHWILTGGDLVCFPCGEELLLDEQEGHCVYFVRTAIVGNP